MSTPRERFAAEVTPGAGAVRQWLLERCRGRALSPTQRRVAHFYDESMPEGAFMSTLDAASGAGVSQATITRFAAALGFATYGDFQSELRRHLLGISGAGSAPALRHSLGEAIDTLQRLGETLDSPAFDAAVGILASVRTVGVVGVRASEALAHHFGYFAGRILDDVRVITHGETAFDAIHQLADRGDAAVLVFAMPRYPEVTVSSLALAHRLGLPTVLVVDAPFVDFAGEADQVLVAPVTSDLVFDSYPAPVMLATTLLDRLAAAQPRRSQERLETHESLVGGWVHRSPTP